MLLKPGYIGSFFFYLDFVASISLLPDALLLWEIQVGTNTDTASGTTVQLLTRLLVQKKVQILTQLPRCAGVWRHWRRRLLG
jgi:hypothetical protein